MYINISQTEFWIGIAVFVGTLIAFIFRIGGYWAEIQKETRESREARDQLKAIPNLQQRVGVLEATDIEIRRQIEKHVSKSDFRELKGEVRNVAEKAIRAEAKSFHDEKEG